MIRKTLPLLTLILSLCAPWSAQADETRDYASFVGMDIFSVDEHQEYLGYIIEDIFNEDSIINAFGGFFGSSDDFASIHNRDGAYGSPFEDYSAYNPNAKNPPIIYYWNGKDWQPEAYLTQNHNLKEITVDPDGLLDYLWSRILDFPTGVAASDGEFSDRIRVSWEAVPNAAYYQVYRSTSPEGEEIEEVGSWQSKTSIDDTSAKSDVDYYYWVRAAVDTKGNRGSDFSYADAGWRRTALEAPFQTIELGDMNGDGRHDLVIEFLNSGIANIALMGAGATTWTASYESDWKNNYELLATGDLNGDGRDDLILKYKPSQTVYLCMMNPTATGWTVSYYSQGWYEKYTLLGVGDLNGDGRDDLILRYNKSMTVYICHMNPPGADKIWTVAYYSQGWAAKYSIRGVGDLNGDGRDDLILRYNKSGTIYFCIMNPSGTSWNVAAYETWGDFLSMLALADLNGDGREDIIVRDNVSGEVLFFHTDSSGIPAQEPAYAGDWGNRTILLATGDLNGDGRDDLIFGDKIGSVDFALMRSDGANWDLSLSANWSNLKLLGGTHSSE